MRGALFVTGASGFVGRRVLAVAASEFSRVIALARGELTDAPQGVECVRGDLLGDASWESALAGCDAVLHLAAITGKAAPREVERGVVEATAKILAAARRAGVRHFVYASSIAVRFTDQAHYPYAKKKAAAEALVRGSGLGATIVRPAIVAGPGSPVMSGLATLALAPLTPVFGDGRKRVAPIHVDDLAERLVLLAAGEPQREAIELGGPEAFTIDALLVGIRRARCMGEAKLLHLPLAPIRALLAALEPVLRPVLPLTAGQLATFANDGLPAPNAFAAAHPAARAVISPEALAPPAPRADSDAVLRAECTVFSQRLLGIAASPALCARYVEQQRALGLDRSAGFDALLLALARRGGIALALADAYSGWLARRSLLRTKLVGLLALLETSAESFAAIDAPDSRLAWPRLVLRALREGATALLAALLLLPLHLLLRRR